MIDTLSNLNAIALKLLGTLSLEETYKIVVEEATKLSSTTYGTIFLEYKGTFNRAYSTLPKNLQVKPRNKGFVYKAFKEGKIFIIPRRKLTSIHPEMNHIDTVTLVVIPLMYRGKSIGVLNLHSYDKSEFRQEEMEQLKIFASMASLAIQTAYSYGSMKDALELRDFFIALAGHELRTPLTVISGYVDLLKQRINKNQPIDNKWLEQLEWESNRLKHMVHDMLEVNKLKAGRLQFDLQERDLKHIIQRAMREFGVFYPKRTLTFEDNATVYASVIGDDEKLVDVINGVLDNAAKFSHKETNIMVKLNEKDKYFQIAIIDTGKGINKKDIPHIFDGFYKAEGNTKEGLGLGLFMAKYIIEKHKGKIKLSSKVNKGTIVTIQLPKIKKI